MVLLCLHHSKVRDRGTNSFLHQMFYSHETKHTQGYAALTILVAPFLMTKAALVSDGANT